MRDLNRFQILVFACALGVVATFAGGIYHTIREKKAFEAKTLPTEQLATPALSQ